jgi:hypothetical protein
MTPEERSDLRADEGQAARVKVKGNAELPPSGLDVCTTRGKPGRAIKVTRRLPVVSFNRLGGLMPHQIDNAMRECIQNCQECHAICTETVAHCLEKGGKHAAAEHIRLLLDCAEICATSADFMLRVSPEHARTCGVCAELCSQCADSCEQLGKGDQTMSQCAELCRRCAQSCERMSGVRA